MTLLLVGSMAATLPGMVMAAGQTGVRHVRATELYYRKFPHGREPYLSRLLVTTEFLRFDNGHASSDFLLFNRRNRTIYSIDHEDQTVLVIAPQPVDVKSPIPLKLTERHAIAHDAPTIDGHHAVHYTFYANNNRCIDVMVVKGLLDGVRKALMSFKETLAGQQAADMDKTPLSMQSACSLANLIFSPTRTLSHGLPILEWRPDGDRKELLNYRRNVFVSNALFRLPRGYRFYAIGADGMITIPAPSSASRFSSGTIQSR